MDFKEFVETHTIGEIKKAYPQIKDYLDNDCEMKENYKKRVDKFYKYNDQNNSKRVYDWIYEN